MISRRTIPHLIFLFTLLLFSASAHAGPPYFTDDPEPVQFGNWEIYLATQSFHDRNGFAGTAPHIEINEGIFPDVQLHIIAPFSYVRFSGGNRYGYGDTEFGVKYRFVRETSSAPQVGTFPLMEIPTGNSRIGLGSGRIQVFLPIWLQKSWGRWTGYGGGGYWYNPGPGNKNWRFTGAVIQRAVSDNLSVGMELFHATPATNGGMTRMAFCFGTVYDLAQGHHFLFSIGRDLDGRNPLTLYFAHLWTFGPR